MRIEGADGEEVIEAERRRCLAVAVRTARGGVRVGFEVGGVSIGCRKVLVGVGRERAVREVIRWVRVGCWAAIGLGWMWFVMYCVRGVVESGFIRRGRGGRCQKRSLASTLSLASPRSLGYFTPSLDLPSNIYSIQLTTPNPT